MASFLVLLAASPTTLFAQAKLSLPGEGVFNTNLTDKQKKELIADLREKTGLRNIYFDKNDKLVIDRAAGFGGGSTLGRKVLQDAVGSTSLRFNLESVNSREVAFARGDEGQDIECAKSEKLITEYTIQIDFNVLKRR